MKTSTKVVVAAVLAVLAYYAFATFTAAWQTLDTKRIINEHHEVINSQ